MDEHDQAALAALMALQPGPGQPAVSEERREALAGIEGEHVSKREKRQALAREAEWTD